MKTEKHITHNAGLIATGTMVSRILGYLRDMFVAHAFGAGLTADAFYAAYRIPNLLRRLLGEGALSASFIPVLSEYLHTKSKAETQKLINVIFTALVIILTLLTALGIIFAPGLVKLIAYGFTSDPDKISLTINLTRLMFPFVLFICLAALALGILNTFSSFFIPAVAPASLSISEIAFILGVAPLVSPDNRIQGLAISVIIGGFFQFIIQWPKIKKLGWHLGWSFNLKHPGLKRVGLLMLPAMLGLSVDQINAFVGTIIASFLEQGSITALYYSNRIMQLPLAIFGLSLASVALPTMSKAAAQKNIESLKDSLNFSLRLITFILIPSAVGLIVIGLPIIRVLFERGNFDYRASLLTNSALVFYSLGLPAYASVKVLASSFYAFQQTKTPVNIAAVAMVLNVILSLLFMKPFGVGGLALATSISSWFNVFILAYLLRKKIGRLGMKRIAVAFFKTSFASILMGITSYLIAFNFLKNIPSLGMIISIIAGVFVFFVSASLIKIEERKPIWSIIFKEEPTGED